MALDAVSTWRFGWMWLWIGSQLLLTAQAGPLACSHRMQAVTGWEVTSHSSKTRALQSFGYETLSQYEWNKPYNIVLEADGAKAICFEQGTTVCVKYSFASTPSPILAFVAERQWTGKVLEGAAEVKHINGSVCSGFNCTTTHVFVSAQESYCVVFLNRDNSVPHFVADANSTISVYFRVAGCGSAVWKMIYVVAVIVVMLVLMGCCVGALVHLRKVRLLPRPAYPSHNTQLVAVGRGTPIPEQPTLEYQIPFTVAKI